LQIEKVEKLGKFGKGARDFHPKSNTITQPRKERICEEL